MSEPKIKMYCIFSKEALKKMNGIRGKLASQAGHAYLHAFWDAYDEDKPTESVYAADAYRQGRAYKITLSVETDAELKEIVDSYKDICGAVLIEDAGLTVFGEPTVTCAGIGPVSDSDLLDNIKSLRTLT